MIPVKLAAVAEDCGGRFHRRAGTAVTDEAVRGLETDTRRLSEGEVFAAIKGERVDGASLAGQALAAGAVAVVTADPQAASASGAPPERLVVVDDVQAAVGRLAAANLERARRTGNPDLRVVAVTGSVGKTTTKDLLAGLLSSRGPVVAPPGSFNNELGLPLTVLRTGADTASLVLEMGADHVGNIDYLTSIAPPDVSAVLAVARAHLGEFGGIDNVARAKSELVSGTREGGTVVLNADDERVAAMASKGAWPVTLRLVGEHHVANALAAAAVARALGVDPRQAASALGRHGAASPHRMDVFEAGGATVIDDAYNANPDSMRAGLRGLERIGAGRRKLAVLGEMLELGGESEAEHASLGEEVGRAGVSLLACLPGTRALSQAAADAGVGVHDAPDAADALAWLRATLAPGDAVLLKGSHGSGVWRIADALREETK